MVCLETIGPILKGAREGMGIGELYGTSAFWAGEIYCELREVDVNVGRGGTAVETCRQIGIAEQTLYRWRKEYAGRSVHRPWPAPAYSVRQWARVVTNAVREWLGRLGVTTLYIEPGSLWENG